jgi:hypothetical protein
MYISLLLKKRVKFSPFFNYNNKLKYHLKHRNEQIVITDDIN